MESKKQCWERFRTKFKKTKQNKNPKKYPMVKGDFALKVVKVIFHSMSIC